MSVGEPKPTESSPLRLAGQALAVLWALGLLGYYYVSHGFLPLISQVWASLFG